ncbi:MAG: exonuclease subunit SbcD, partial [Clostridia bacterium]|nr:exonuclease subunit SbcD [Clostridia bacterium]
MKLMHLSDLHLGKRLNEYSLLEDQKHILVQITGIIDDERPDAVIIAGDVYDKAVPPAEAVAAFDDFLYGLARRKLRVFVISGNHDSPERIAFGSRIMDAGGIHMSPVYNGKIEPVRLADEYGEADFWLLPFVKPAHVRGVFKDAEIATYTDALRAAIGGMEIDTAKRNVLVTHQFVTGSTESESEERSVGGTDNVDAEVFDAFD